MKSVSPFLLEYLLIAAVAVISVLGFWDIYFGDGAGPQPHHHLHVITAFIWLGLILFQLTRIEKRDFAAHRRVGLAVLFFGPLLVATTAMLSVHSAHRALVAGQGDFLIVQNVMGTLELGFLIFLAFFLRQHRKLHGAFLMSTTIVFLGIALFFALISFAPPFRIEGPETFYRFGTAAMTGSAICISVGLLFLIRDFRNGWPFLMAGLFFLLNDGIKAILNSNDLIDPLTAFVGSLSQPLTFVGSFAVLLGLLAATGVVRLRR